MSVKSLGIFLLSAAAAISLSACNQASSELSTTSTPVAADQAAWKKLTTEADAALKGGDKAAAEAKYKEAIEAAKIMAADSPEHAAAVANLANFYYAQGDGAQANQLYSQSLAMHEKALGLMHIDLVTDLVGLAKVYVLEKKYAEAQASYQRAIDISKKADKSTADLENELAKVKELSGKAK